MTIGRPPAFKTPEELEAKINDYFENCPDNITHADTSVTRRYTKCGLAIHLGFASKTSMYDYEKKPEFMYLIKKATSLVEKGYELKLHGKHPTGAIFALKNMGWNDKVINENFNTNLTTDTPPKETREQWEKRQKAK